MLPELVHEQIENRIKEDGKITPLEQRGGYWFKRDDLYEEHGSRGGKTRTCWYLCQKAKKEGYEGVVTAGSKKSPQIQIVAMLGKALGLKVRAHCPKGELGTELGIAKEYGAEIIQHRAGYNNVIIARAREDAAETGYYEIPFGMEDWEAVYQTATQVKSLVDKQEIKRLVVPVGSGMSLSGILWGIDYFNLDLEVVGVVVGADPLKRLETFAPAWWKTDVSLVYSKYDYHDMYPNPVLEGVELDPIYEGKMLDFIEEGDCLWCVGIRRL